MQGSSLITTREEMEGEDVDVDVDVESSDVCCIFWSSGTTGAPKAGRPRIMMYSASIY
jgi:acyl-coenzyme A synthetase/AMP-(fatty) acid ligase